MAYVVSRLFRHPKAAEKALASLKKEGYTVGEVGFVHRVSEEGRGGHKEEKEVTLAELGRVVVGGACAQLAKEDGDLLHKLGVPSDALPYYKVGLEAGGVLVAVATEEAKAAKAKKILRAAEAPTEGAGIGPGFFLAERMTESNPVDAQMTGDFRRY